MVESGIGAAEPPRTGVKGLGTPAGPKPGSARGWARGHYFDSWSFSGAFGYETCAAGAKLGGTATDTVGDTTNYYALSTKDCTMGALHNTYMNMDSYVPVFGDLFGGEMGGVGYGGPGFNPTLAPVKKGQEINVDGINKVTVDKDGNTTPIGMENLMFGLQDTSEGTEGWQKIQQTPPEDMELGVLKDQAYHILGLILMEYYQVYKVKEIDIIFKRLWFNRMYRQ